MNIKICFVFIFSIYKCYSLSGQSPIIITEGKLKVSSSSTEVYYCGLSKGDKLVFDFKEEKGKELKQIEIIEYPSNIKFIDYKTDKIINKLIEIQNTGIYCFRFTNSSLGARVCDFKIQRIPENESAKTFNTKVFWKTVLDSSYTIENEKYLKSDTTIFKITDQVSQVHSQTNINSNKTSFSFSLPPKTAVWSYYVGVNEAGEEMYKNANDLLQKNFTQLFASIAGFDPLVAIALGRVSYLSQLQKGEDVQYIISDDTNLKLILAAQPYKSYKSGTVINDFSQMLSPLSGTHQFCFINQNLFEAVNVTVKITAVQVTQEWSTHQVRKLHVSQKQEPFLKN